MTNLAFGGHFGFSLPTYLAHVEEMEVLWIMTQDGSLDISRKIQLSLFFSRLNFIAPGLMSLQTDLKCKCQSLKVF